MTCATARRAEVYSGQISLTIEHNLGDGEDRYYLSIEDEKGRVAELDLSEAEWKLVAGVLW